MSSVARESRVEHVRARLTPTEAAALREYSARVGLTPSAVVRHSLTASGALPPADRDNRKGRC